MAAAAQYSHRRSTVLPATVWRRVAGPGQSLIYPDGCMDLIWTGERLLLAGPDGATVRYAPGRPSTLTAIRFHPGIAPIVLGQPADQFLDARLDLADVWPAERVGRWLDALHTTRHPGVVLEKLAVQRLSGSEGMPGWLAPTVGMLAAGVPIGQVADRIGASRRQLQRRSQWHFGYGAKTLQRILRVDGAANLLRAGYDLSEVAYRAGFADYSHMFRDFRDVTGEQPAAFRPAAAPDSGLELHQPSGA
ncbi:MAG: helix-turn-helix domain-containing protein [Actinomycetota bacterium]|nr:helix-turn-helix domain-containing protein [Actinomycetota bacterium]